MGNNTAPTLAINYMNHAEKQLLVQNPSIIMCKRYIDDIFWICPNFLIEQREFFYTIYSGYTNKWTFLKVLHVVPA